MLAIRLRVRPWSERLSRSSSGRVTRTAFLPSSYSTFMARWGASSSLPLGPSTKTLPPSRRTLTPAGTATGCLPMRDIFASRSPDRAEEFAAQPLGPRPPVAHHAAAGAEHADPQPVEHRLELGAVPVEAAPRPAGP